MIKSVRSTTALNISPFILLSSSMPLRPNFVYILLHEPPLQGFVDRDNYPCGVIPVTFQLILLRLPLGVVVFKRDV